MARFSPDDPFTPDAVALLEELRQQSWDALSALPAHQQRELHRGGRRGTLSTYRDVLPGDKVRVVVQTYVPRWFGIMARVMADGFVVGKNGELSPMENEDLYDFT